jgi:RNA polymerase sigma-70 factor (ECF subfamily)
MKLDPREFERLALEQIDLLYRVARRLTRDPNRAEDLVQETYLRALRSKEGFNLEDFGMKPWLLRILHNRHQAVAARAPAGRR